MKWNLHSKHLPAIGSDLSGCTKQHQRKQRSSTQTQKTYLSKTKQSSLSSPREESTHTHTPPPPPPQERTDMKMVSFRSIAFSLFVSTMLLFNVVGETDTTIDDGEFDNDIQDDINFDVDIEANDASGDTMASSGVEDRRLTYQFYKYEDKACRTYDGFRGSDGHEYHLYHESYRSDCEDRCGRYCTGYEWKASSGRCEIWKVPIEEFAYKHGFDCYVKKSYSSSTRPPTHPPTRHPTRGPTRYPTRAPTRHPTSAPKPDYDYEGYDNNACRNEYGKQGSNGHEYDLYYRNYESGCKHLCNSKHDCEAYEYRYSDGRCEIWKEIPGYVRSKHGFKCSIRIH